MKTNFLLIVMIVLGATFSQAQNYNFLNDHQSSVFTCGYGKVGGDFIKSPKTAPRETSIIYASNEGWKGTYVNPSSGKSINYSGGLTLKPGMVMMHPGNGADHLSKIRFTAPSDGKYTMNVKWTAIDQQAKKTFTWIYTNAAAATGKTYSFTPKGFKELFGKEIRGVGNSAAFQKTITMKKGEVISFEIGNGGDRYYDDALSIELSITSASTVASVPLTSADFNGIWSDNMPIKVTGNKVVVDMSAHGRPNATGTLIDKTTIRVTFPDDKTYTGKLVAKNKIQWGPNNFWTKTEPLTSADFNGIWNDNMPIKVTGNKVVVDMSAHGRPNATGTLIDETTIRVAFPDDNTYTGKLVAKNKIQWGPNNFWTKSR